MGCAASKTAANKTMAFVGLESKGDPSSRCNMMMKEATVLHAKVKLVSKDVHAFQKAADVSLESVRQLLATPLPKVYEDDAAAYAALMSPVVETVGGQGYSSEAAGKAKEEFTHKSAPRAIDAWMGKYDDALAKQKLLNKAYDGMVASRKKVADAKAKEEALRRSGLGGEDAKVQEAVRVVQTLQDALNVVSEKHMHEEAAQFARLKALNTEASQLSGSIRDRLGESGEALLAMRDAVPAAPHATPPTVSTTTSGAGAAAAAGAVPAAVAAA